MTNDQDQEKGRDLYDREEKGEINQSEKTFGIIIKDTDLYRRRTRKLGILLIVLISLFIFFACCVITLISNRNDLYENGAVTTEVAICSKLGVKIMKERGGNAIDAAIASSLCVSLINNFASGIGGGGFMLIRMPNGDGKVIDFRETAPINVDPKAYEKKIRDPVEGPDSIAIPGMIKGLEVAHNMGGKLKWKELFQDVINMARDGFIVPGELSRRVHKFQDKIRKDVGLNATYMRHNQSIKVGTILKRENLANTFEILAKEGASAFYNGTLSDKIISFLKSKNSVITKDDLLKYTVQVNDPLEGKYLGRRIWTVPAPASGAIALQILGTIEHMRFNDKKHPILDILHGANDAHLFVESCKFAFASRSLLEDPGFPQNQTLLDLQKCLYNESFTKNLAEKIPSKETHTDLNWYIDIVKGSACKIDNHGTSHINVVDKNGMCVSCTTTVNYNFGSYLMDPDTGILFNNQMDDFSIPGRENTFGIPPGESNHIKAGARPMSSCNPMMIFEKESDERVEYILGGAGGSRIITSTIQVLQTLLHTDKRLDLLGSWRDTRHKSHHRLRDAISAPRIHAQLYNNSKEVSLEYKIPKSIQNQLVEAKHEITILEPDYYLSTVEAIRVHPKSRYIEASADCRKLGAWHSGY
jgi:gamma-glutamyltranspeptidase/glutathione hydrolase/leukotriene-C4 hydrolase